jgi:trimeric autotransporter adhesin
MKKHLLKAICIVSFILIFTNSNFAKAVAVDESTPLNVDDIEITNNAGKVDSIDIIGLSPGDTVYIYKVAEKGKYIAQKTVPLNAEELTVNIPQLGSAGGSVYVSVKTPGMLESKRGKVAFAAEPKSAAPDVDNICITNNAGKADSIFVADLSVGDTFKIYSTAKGKNLICTAKVSSTKSDLSIAVQQLGTNSGCIYVSITSVGMLESNRIKVDFSAEGKSDAPNSENILVTNNAGKPDTIYLSNVNSRDTIKVYSALKGGKLLCSLMVLDSQNEACLKTPQLGVSEGSVYISITSDGMLQSDKVKVDYASESKSTNLSLSQVVITNNAGKSDNIKVTGLSESDVIKVYTTEKGVITLCSGTVQKNSLEANITIAQLGAGGGNVFISLTNVNRLEGQRIKVDFSGEERSAAPVASNISVVNSAGIQDTVKATDLAASEIVKVYDSVDGGKLLGSATVSTNSDQALVSITQLGTNAGNLFVSVTSPGKTESTRTSIAYSAEIKSNTVEVADVTVQNNAGGVDKVTVIHLEASDVIKVYATSTAENSLGTATVSVDSNEVSLAIKQIGVNAGNLYVSVKKYGKGESDRIKVDFIAEPTALLSSNISVENNVLIADTVKVSNINYNDVIKVYDAAAGGNMIGLSRVQPNSTETTVSIPQLSTSIGSVYVSITYNGMGESVRTKVDYSAEQSSTPIFIGNVNITNNKGTADIVVISNLNANDVVKIYDSEKSGVLISQAKVPYNATQVTLSITQLGANGGCVYISITSAGKNESTRIKIDFTSETP